MPSRAVGRIGRSNEAVHTVITAAAKDESTSSGGASHRLQCTSARSVPTASAIPLCTHRNVRLLSRLHDRQEFAIRVALGMQVSTWLSRNARFSGIGSLLKPAGILKIRSK